jgi:eukaryotic-like serine/threonine-protein kinase
MLAPGARIGSFEILGLLGAGGMGEVYRARDPRLGREVAIKVLPPERLADEGRRRRFEQEAQAASALNHPHIVTIHGIDASDGIDFIVMEYVPGQTLDGLIPKSGMRLGEALRLSIPIADALAAAHARGIVHRDLKPANVIVTRDGVVKVLDFGLAKLVDDDNDDTGETKATESGVEPLTRPGAITGTAGYMSPEQATGGRVDARSDIFSFGAVLYEMVTGRRAFAGRTVSETLTAVVRDQPRALRELVPGIPEALERLVLRCLRKEPERRFHHMVDVKVELQEVKEESDSQASTAGRAVAKSRSWRSRVMWATSGTLILAAASLSLWRLRQPALPPPTVVQLSSERWAGSGSFSPDGTQIAYESAGGDGENWDIWLKIVGEVQARRLTTDPATEGYPAWSPDGTEIAFLRYYAGNIRGISWFATGAIHLVSPLGGPSRRLSDFPARLQLSWSPDGRWLAAAKARSGTEPPGGIHLISVADGQSRPLTFPKAPAFDISPSFSPGARALAYATCVGAEGAPICEVCVLDLDSDLRPRAAARPLTRLRLRAQGLAWTRDGRSIVFATAAATGSGGLWRVPADGSRPPVRIELAGVQARTPFLSAGRDRLAFVRPAGDSDIYQLRPGGPATPLVESTYAELQPQWSPDGRRITFLSERAGSGQDIWLADADGRNLARLTHGPGRSQGYPGWSPDGRSIVFDSQNADGYRDVFTMGSDGSGLHQVTHDPADDVMPSWSRDGRSIYYSSNRTGRFEVWRVSVAGGAEEQLTREGGTHPFESVDGRTLYYRGGGSATDGPLLARPTAGGEARTILPCVPIFGYAVAPGGLFHHDCVTPETGGSPERPLRYRDAATGQDRLVARLDADWIGGLSVSPDGKTILYARGTSTSDLMMIESFR